VDYGQVIVGDAFLKRGWVKKDAWIQDTLEYGMYIDVDIVHVICITCDLYPLERLFSSETSVTLCLKRTFKKFI
jgi:hypothetical protein